MITILEGADFSANNVGQIVLPTPLLDFTKKIFTHCTRFSANSEQAQIVNAFIQTLVTQEVLSHISFFIAPWLSADLNEALYDIAGDNQMTSASHTITNGKIAAANSLDYISLTEGLKAKNFFGSIVGGSTDRSPIWSGVSGTGLKPMVLFKGYDSGSWIAFQVNPNAGNGYHPTDLSTLSTSHKLLFNITELSDLESGSSTINGVSVTPSTSYGKSYHEPFVDSITKFATAENTTGRRLIMFGGDGTNLNSTQITALVSALQTMYASLQALETD